MNQNGYLDLIAVLVAQHCYESDGVYESGCISANAEALRLLCEKGWMIPEGEGFGRQFQARFKMDGPITGFIGHNPINAETSEEDKK